MFALGETSERRLEGVDPRLVAIVRRAIATTTIDFSVVCGLRTQEEQDRLYEAGASRRRDSYHLTGHAVDLCSYIGGQLCWKLGPMSQVTLAVREASIHFRSPVIWGAVWDRELAALEPSNLNGAIRAYRERYHASHGLDADPLLDAWHFQVPR